MVHPSGKVHSGAYENLPLFESSKTFYIHIVHETSYSNTKDACTLHVLVFLPSYMDVCTVEPLSRNTTFYPQGGVCSTWLLKHWTRTHPKSQQGVTLDFPWISAQKISQTFILSLVSSPADGIILYWCFCVCVLQVIGCGNENWL